MLETHLFNAEKSTALSELLLQVRSFSSVFRLYFSVEFNCLGLGSEGFSELVAVGIKRPVHKIKASGKL